MHPLKYTRFCFLDFVSALEAYADVEVSSKHINRIMLAIYVYVTPKVSPISI